MKISKIVIEGPNNVGKSTFCNKVQLMHDFEYEHLSQLCPNDFMFHYDLLNVDKNMIFDRFAVGELVYSEIYHRKPKVDVHELIELLRRDDTIVVFIDADYEFIVKACLNKGEMFDYEMVKQEKLLFDQYYDLLRKHDVKVIRIKHHLKEEPNYSEFEQLLRGENNG